MTTNLDLVRQIDTQTADAYSRSRYTDAAWFGIIKLILAQGATQAETILILESQHMRRAAEAANRRHSTTISDFLDYANSAHVGSMKALILAASHELAKRAPAPQQAAAPATEHYAALLELARQLANEQALTLVGARRLTEQAQALIAKIDAKGGR